MTTENFLTIQEAAEFLNLKISNLRSKVFREEIPVVRMGRLIRFDKDALEQYLGGSKKSSIPRRF